MDKEYVRFKVTSEFVQIEIIWKYLNSNSLKLYVNFLCLYNNVTSILLPEYIN
jgi:hypothetical protein